jgi:hypothetical protein
MRTEDSQDNRHCMVADLVHLRVALSIATTQPISLPMMFVLSLAIAGQSAKQRVVALSYCRPVASEARQTARDVWRVVAMSPCRLAYI